MNPRRFPRNLGVLAAVFALIAGGTARSDNTLPFLPPPAPAARTLKLLAYPDYFDPAAIEAFERASGFEVAYDSYPSPSAIAEKWRDGPYDVVLLPGPQLQRGIREGALARLDRSRLPDLKSLQPAVAAKFAAYDPGNLYAAPYGWSPFGLIYDADKVAHRLSGPPASWSNVLVPRDLSRVSDCGVALPGARDSLFAAVLRLANVDPARAGPIEVKNAVAVLQRARSAIRAFAPPDLVGALARGAICLGAGSPAEAEAAAARSGAGGAPLPIRFAYAREGGPVAIDALAIPRDAPHPEQAYALMEFLLRPEIAKANAAAAHVFGAEDPGQIEALKKSWPEGQFDERVRAAIEAEWTKLLAAK